ncbi:MAG: TIGR03905 family TSCPD domain-containing protein [Clostridia bacterium]|nr:TIGR03905 family TSCPD domain-containing protein [Clostridia bacterium]
MYHYRNFGTCSESIDLEIRDGIISDCRINGGCRGNTQGLSKMVIGRKAEEVRDLLRGIQCRNGTSCPDQLSRAIDECLRA